MRFEITKEHIADAKRRDSQHCMIADAIQARTDAKYVLVDVQTIRWSNLKKGKRYVYLTPPEAQRAILAFDQGKRVEPFSFTVDNPVHVWAVSRFKANTEATRRARAKYERTGRKRAKRKPVVTREREFGMRVLTAH